MGTVCLSMWWRLVLTYQLVMRIVLELNLSGWRCIDLVVANIHKAQEGALGDLVVYNTFGEISVGTLQARGSY
jgi:hypothetical protein